MAQATFHFPRGFLWGTATSSHQVEGNNTNNNWWAWEQEEGRIIHGHKSGLACDWWGGRWREDLDRAAEAGQNAHRLSIEWSRIQPEPDRWDEGALDRYREILRGMQERNLTPMVTLHHFSDPIWFSQQGGWESERCPELFAAYVNKAVEALREYTSLWVTINEPNVLVFAAYYVGVWPPGKKSPAAVFRVMTNQLRAHAAAYRLIHKLQPTARVGLAFNYMPFTPAVSWSPLDRLLAKIQGDAFNEALPRALAGGVLRFLSWRRRLPEVKGTQDYLGINYYLQEKVSFFSLFQSMEKLPSSTFEGNGSQVYHPQGMFEAVRWGLKSKVPIIITENGVADAEDLLRRRYMIEHLHQLWRAVNFNYPVKGYFHWSLVDNFEWERGWTQRFGLWELDVETQVRRKRPSADLYAEICRENGISSEMVARYAPEIFEKIFPN